MLTSLLLFSSAAFSQNILFLGNSYTIFNDLHRVTHELLIEGQPSEWEGGVPARLADGGLLFSNHLERTEQAGSPWQIALGSDEESWDWVVMQEQSQIPGFPKSDPYVQQSIESAIGLDALAEARGAQTVFLLTWGRRSGDSQNPERFPDFTTMQDRLTEGYLRYIDATTTKERPTWIAPAGLAFAEVYETLSEGGEDPLTEGSVFWSLYTDDGSHPSPSGTYLTACVIYAAITGSSPKGLSLPDALPAAIGELLQNAAHAAVFEHTDQFDFPWEKDETTGTLTETSTETSTETEEPTEETEPEAEAEGEDSLEESSSSRGTSSASGCKGSSAMLLVGLWSLLGLSRRDR